ncbi:unnamed protein product [Protopolystoma xenopodis]|uniref:DUF5736 domain-containing protein n=1 Tax=Protopolystoma xenopodis TaxID=117903 RepID=A0A448XCS5_9PLAT|nr:unnamed protein product [Protopolystoma xenopodis]
MSLYRPVYQSVLTQEPIDETPENRWEGESNGESRPSGPPDVKRRGRSVRDRLNTIVSMYVPSSGQQRIQPSRLGYQAVPTREKEDKAKCPSSEGTTVATTAGSISLNEVVDGSDTNYEIQFLFRGLDLIDELCKCVSAAPSIKDTGEAHARARKIVALAYAADSLLICLEDLPYIFIIAAPGSSIPLAGKEEEVSYMPRSSESTSHPQSGCSHGLQERAQTMVGEPGVSQYLEPEDVVIQTWIHLNLGDNGELYPSEICARGNANTGSLEEVYVTGRTFVAEMKKGPKLPHFLLLRLTLNDAPPLRSRVYDYQRYAGVDIDADGHLLLACPAILRPSEKVCILLCRM